MRTECRSTSTHPSSETAQLEQVLAVVRDALGPDVVGVYLFGSAVLGGLKPRSDLDVLVVSSRRLSPEEKRRLGERVLGVSGHPLRPLELTVVAQPEIRPWRYPPRMELQYGEWLRDEFEHGDVEPEREANPDLALLIAQVLLADRPLYGPPPADVFEPVPRADLVRALLADVEEVMPGIDTGTDTRNGVLTLARIWGTAATGEIRSKHAAAEWALERLPAEHRAVLARARAVYVGDEDERWDDIEALIRPHADYVVGEIRRLVG